ncbi:PAS domain-containing protein [Flavobacterium algicola]|uniref:PAS domain-containing protein n=1 Tax=Flavobacterium algicola TaxID=556529 RepID=UPI001EFECC09|nr:PAS domain-containing protein [Flavobacterium algicola]MCG9790961.1 PAS domain-containing protein [Flavobacterium algicola]
MKNNRYKSSVYHKIIFAVSLTVLLFIAVITVKHIKNISDSSKLLMHTYEVNLELEHLYSYIKDSEESMRGYMISKDSLYLKPYRTATKNVNKSFILLKQLTEDSPIQAKKVEALFEIIDKRYQFIDNYSDANTTIVSRQDYFFKKNFRESTELLAKIRNKLNEMIALEEMYLKNRNQLYKNQIYLTPILTLSIIFITLLVLIFAYYKINKDVERLQAANIELNKSQFLSYQAEILSEFGTWEWDLIENKISYSDNFYRILGTEPQSFEANDENFDQYVHPEDKDKVSSIVDNILTNKELPYSYFRIIRPDGEIRLLRATGKLFTDKLNNQTILGVTEDITLEDNKTKLLQQNYNELKIFEESSKQAEILGKYGSWVINYDTMEYIFSNNQFRLLGYEPQSFSPTADNFLEFVYAEDRHFLVNAHEKAQAEQIFPSISYRVTRKDGEIRRFKSNATSFTDITGTRSMIGTTQDVTEDFNKSLQLKDRNRELEQNIKELNEFNHVASHDLQEPLRKIQTFVSRINDKEKDNLSEFGKEYLTRIENASNRMRVLINDLLQYSRTSRSDTNLVPIDLNEVFADSQLELSQIIEDKGATITNSNLPVINGVHFLVQQLFSNLLSNAIKYSKEDVAPVIKLTYSEVSAKSDKLIAEKSNKRYYKFEFVDNGIGFEQEHAEKIFLLFNRLHGKTEYQGTGVGLAICKKIIETHNGYIYATSTPDIGTTFTFYIPV